MHVPYLFLLKMMLILHALISLVPAFAQEKLFSKSHFDEKPEKSCHHCFILMHQQ